VELGLLPSFYLIQCTTGSRHLSMSLQTAGSIFEIVNNGVIFTQTLFVNLKKSKKYSDTKQSNKRNNQNSKSKRQDNHMK